MAVASGLTTTSARMSSAYESYAAPMDQPTPTSRVAGRVAAIGVLLQAAGLLGFAIWEMVQSGQRAPSNVAVFQGSVVYLSVSGVLLGTVGVALWARRSAAFGITVAVQLIVLAIGYEMARSSFWVGALPVWTSAGVVLVGLLSRPGRECFGRAS